MKKLFMISVMLLSQSAVLFSQVAVNSNGSTADTTSMLDVVSTSKGMLVPRMTMDQIEAINDPAIGLLVYCTDDNNFFVNRGSREAPDWTMINSKWRANGLDIYFTGNNVGIGWSSPIFKLDVRGNNPDDAATLLLTNSDQAHKLLFSGGRLNDPNPFIQWRETDALRFGTDQGGGAEKLRITNGGQVGIGTASPHGSALVEMSSGTQGLLPPRMTAGQRMAIAAPAPGLLVYQTEPPSGYYYFTGTNWIGIEGSGAGAISTSSCIDYDGNAYPTFQIGSQVWMAENLRVFHYRNGDAIPNVTVGVDWTALNSGAYCWYDNDQPANAKYGVLYNWFAVDDGRGLCPAGWHVPSDDEWIAFKSYLGGYLVAGGKMKAASDLWISPNTDAVNSSGFTGLPGGDRYWTSGIFNYEGLYGYWWASTSYDPSNARFRYLDYDTAELYESYTNKNAGFSVRCVRDL